VVQALAMMVSRKREYLADASGAELTRNPMGLARALEKIESAAGPTESVNRGTAHLCIADPLGRSINLKEGFWSDLFASHPPMSARIAALKAMGFQGRA
jgi:heat shock protein HtpX